MRWGWCRVKPMLMERASSARGVAPEGKGFPALARTAPWAGAASCSAARSVAMRSRPISMPASMCITPSGVSSIGNHTRKLLPGSVLGEDIRPVRLEVGWEKDGEGTPSDPSQARAANEQTCKVMGLLLDLRGHDSDGEVSRSEPPSSLVLSSENRGQAV